MQRRDEALVLRLMALKDALKNYREILGDIGKTEAECRLLEKKLVYSSKTQDDKRLRVMVDYLVDGKTYSDLARTYAYSREGIKQIIRSHRKKSKNLYPNLYPTKPLQ